MNGNLLLVELQDLVNLDIIDKIKILEKIKLLSNCLDELENELSDKDTEIFYLENCSVSNTFEGTEYNFPIGKVKVWSDSLALEMQLESFVKYRLQV